MLKPTSPFFLLLFLLVISGNKLYSAPALLPVPFVRQAHPYTCGPAALLSLLYYWQVTDEGEASLYTPLKTTEANGTDPENIIADALSLGLKSELKENTPLEAIESALNKKEPVLVDFQAWSEALKPNYKDEWESGHYAVIVGMDLTYLYFMDPVIPLGHGVLSKVDFLERWHDYEIRNGQKIKIERLAIFIRGTEALKALPALAIPIP